MTLLFCLLYLFVLGTVLRKLKFDRAEIGILLPANCLFLYWMLHTNVYYFEMDIRGHLKYIFYMSTHSAPPHPRSGWVFYHPPLYYLLMGKLKAFVDHLGYFRSLGYEFLRYPSLILFN